MPDPTQNNRNAFSILEDRDVDDDEISVVTSNIAPKKNGAYKATSTIEGGAALKCYSNLITNSKF